jgi:hypothetical protein
MIFSDNFAREFIAGNVGGICGIICVYPMDTAKIRLQTYPPARYYGMIGVFSDMIHSNGVCSIYTRESVYRVLIMI